MTTSADSTSSGTEATACKHEIAILVPCFNEELTVGKTVTAFRKALPQQQSTSTTTTRPIAPSRLLGLRARLFAARRARERGMSSVACSPTSTPTSLCWWTATRPMKPSRPSHGSPSDRGKSGLRQRRARVPQHGSLPKRPPVRQLRPDRNGAKHVWQAIHRHVVGLQGFFPPLRQILSRNVERVRDRN